MTDKIIITDWDCVDKEDFYLSEKWISKQRHRKRLRRMAKNGRLYHAYLVYAVHYCIYHASDCLQVFIDDDWNVLLECEVVPVHFPYDNVREYIGG